MKEALVALRRQERELAKEMKKVQRVIAAVEKVTGTGAGKAKRKVTRKKKAAAEKEKESASEPTKEERASAGTSARGAASDAPSTGRTRKGAGRKKGQRPGIATARGSSTPPSAVAQDEALEEKRRKAAALRGDTSAAAGTGSS